jgi:hypothetical protein
LSVFIDFSEHHAHSKNRGYIGLIEVTIICVSSSRFAMSAHLFQFGDILLDQGQGWFHAIWQNKGIKVRVTGLGLGIERKQQ